MATVFGIPIDFNSLTTSIVLTQQVKESCPTRPQITKITQKILAKANHHNPWLKPVQTVIDDYCQPPLTPAETIITVYLFLRSNEYYDWNYMGLICCHGSTRSLVTKLNKFIKSNIRHITTTNYLEFVNIDCAFVFEHEFHKWWNNKRPQEICPDNLAFCEEDPTTIEEIVDDIGYNLGPVYKWTWINNTQVALQALHELNKQLEEIKKPQGLPEHLRSLITPEVIMEQIKKSNKPQDWHCPVCLQDYNETEIKPTLTKCGHVICNNCLPKCTTCPMCRDKL